MRPFLYTTFPLLFASPSARHVRHGRAADASDERAGLSKATPASAPRFEGRGLCPHQSGQPSARYVRLARLFDSVRCTTQLRSASARVEQHTPHIADEPIRADISLSAFAFHYSSARLRSSRLLSIPLPAAGLHACCASATAHCLRSISASHNSALRPRFASVSALVDDFISLVRCRLSALCGVTRLSLPAACAPIAHRRARRATSGSAVADVQQSAARHAGTAHPARVRHVARRPLIAARRQPARHHTTQSARYGQRAAHRARPQHHVEPHSRLARSHQAAIPRHGG